MFGILSPSSAQARRCASKVDGSQLGADYTIGTATIFNSTSPLRIGATNSTPLAFFSGYVGPIRLTKAARTITAAPTAPFPRPTISGIVRDSGAAYVAKVVKAFKRSTMLLAGESVSNGGTGHTRSTHLTSRNTW